MELLLTTAFTIFVRARVGETILCKIPSNLILIQDFFDPFSSFCSKFKANLIICSLIVLMIFKCLKKIYFMETGIVPRKFPSAVAITCFSKFSENFIRNVDRDIID